MSPQEKAKQAVDLLREAAAEIVGANQVASGFTVMKALGIDKSGVGISLRKLLGLAGLWHADAAANASKPQNCCGGASVDQSPPAS